MGLFDAPETRTFVSSAFLFLTIPRLSWQRRLFRHFRRLADISSSSNMSDLMPRRMYIQLGTPVKKVSDEDKAKAAAADARKKKVS